MSMSYDLLSFLQKVNAYYKKIRRIHFSSESGGTFISVPFLKRNLMLPSAHTLAVSSSEKRHNKSTAVPGEKSPFRIAADQPTRQLFLFYCPSLPLGHGDQSVRQGRFKATLSEFRLKKSALNIVSYHELQLTANISMHKQENGRVRSSFPI